MYLVRFTLPLFALSGIIALYWVLHQTIVVSGAKKLSSSSLGDINFVRVLNETPKEKKQRIKKEPPKQKIVKTPPKVSVKMSQPKVDLQAPKLNINIPKLDLPVNIQNNSFLDGAVVVSQVAQNAEAVPILRIPPIYPRRAKMLKKQGYVKIRLYISEQGLVHKAEILESNPKKIFDKAALNSVYGWKFKPKVVDGKAVHQMAEQIVEFKLR